MKSNAKEDSFFFLLFTKHDTSNKISKNVTQDTTDLTHIHLIAVAG